MLGTGVQQLLACASRGVLGRASGVSQPCGDAPLGSTTSPSAEVSLHPRRGRTRSNGAASLAPSVAPMGVTHADIAYKLTLGPVGKEAIKVMEKIVGNLMVHGKKAVAQRILLDAMLIMRERLAAGEAAVASEGAASESAAGGPAAVTAAAGGARSAAAAKGKGKGK